MSAELAIAKQVNAYGMRLKKDIFKLSSWEKLIETAVNTDEIYATNTHILVGSMFGTYNPYVLNIDGSNKIEILNPGTGNNFGNSISLNSTKIAISNKTADTDKGTIYTYNLDGTNLLKISASDGIDDDYFGTSVDISETHIVVGAFGADARAGVAYIFNIDGTNEIKITPPDSRVQNNFGVQVAINSTHVFISSPGTDNLSGSEPKSGCVFMYDLSGVLIKQFYPQDGVEADYFGESLQVNETHIIVSDRWKGAGTAYLFNIDTQEQVVIVPDPEMNIAAYFAFNVQISDTQIILGASHDDTDSERVGSAYVYDLTGANRIRIQQQTKTPSGYFGYANTINDDNIIVSADNDGDSYELTLHSLIDGNDENFINVSQDIIDSGIILEKSTGVYIPYYEYPPFVVEFTTTGGEIVFYTDKAGKYTINDGKAEDVVAGANTIQTIAGDIIRIHSKTTSFKFDEDYQLIETCSVDAKLMTSIEDLCNNQRYMTTFNMINSGNITNMRSAFMKCYGLTDFPLINTSSVTDMTYTWYHCMYITEFPLIDTSSVTNMRQTWYECRSLTEFPLIDTSSVTSMLATWGYCFKLTEFPLIDTSSVTQFSSTWWFCFGLISFPAIDTSIATSVSQAWMGCTGLETFPVLDYGLVVWFQSAWKDASSLESLTLLDTSTGERFATLFEGCTSLKCLSGIDTTSAVDTEDMFKDCDALINPSSHEQGLIEGRAIYVNSGSCPSTSTETPVTAAGWYYITLNTDTYGDYDITTLTKSGGGFGLDNHTLDINNDFTTIGAYVNNSYKSKLINSSHLDIDRNYTDQSVTGAFRYHFTWDKNTRTWDRTDNTDYYLHPINQGASYSAGLGVSTSDTRFLVHVSGTGGYNESGSKPNYPKTGYIYLHDGETIDTV